MINSQRAINIVVKNHYLHRSCPISKAFGLFEYPQNILKGVITYGVSPSSTLLKGIAGEQNQHNVYELNRLWIDKSVPKNGESWFVMHTIPLLDKEIIVSYADTKQNHLGIIYQACSAYYTGKSIPFQDPKVKGLENQHHATFAHGMSIEQIKETFGDKVSFEERSIKHRYVFLNPICKEYKKKRKKELLSQLKYPILPYPKTL